MECLTEFPYIYYSQNITEDTLTPNSLKASASWNSQVLSKHYLHVTSVR